MTALVDRSAPVGEIASCADLPRTANVIAKIKAFVYFASQSLARETVETVPDRAATRHRIVAMTLAERLDRTNKHLGDQT